MEKTLVLATGVTVEQVGSELLLTIPGSLEIVRLSGVAAEVVLAIQSGVEVDPMSSAVNDLIDLGVVTDRFQTSRRGLIRAGAIGAGAGIAVLAMPGVAAASSSGCLPLNGTYEPFSGGVPWNFVVAERNSLYGIPAPRFPESPPAGDPSSLTVGENVYSKPDVDLSTPGSQRVTWSGSDPGGFPNPIVGEFTWGGQCYTVTFTMVPL